MIGNVVQGLSEMREKLSENREMSEAVGQQMSLWVREASEPAQPGEHIGQRIRRAAKRLGLSESRAKRFWYGEKTRVSAAEYLSVQDRLHAIADDQLRLMRRRMAVTEAKKRAYEREQAAVADLFELRK